MYLLAWAVIIVLVGILSFQIILQLAKQQNRPVVITTNNQASLTPVNTSTPSPTVISKTVQQLIMEDPQLSEFNQILNGTPWAAKLAVEEGYTVFAPTNQSLADLTAAERTTLLGTTPTKSTQQQFVARYIVKRLVSPADLLEITSLNNVANQRITISVETSQVTLNKTIVVANDEQQATNGFLYRIAGLLFK